MDRPEREDYTKKLELINKIKLMQHEKAAAEAKQKIDRQNIKTSFSQIEREHKEYNRLFQVQLAKEVKPPSLIKTNKPQYTNDPKLQQQIILGKPVFKREINLEKSRAGRNRLTGLMNQT